MTLVGSLVSFLERPRTSLRQTSGCTRTFAGRWYRSSSERADSAIAVLWVRTPGLGQSAFARAIPGKWPLPRFGPVGHRTLEQAPLSQSHLVAGPSGC